ncbi:MAG: FkbM family methyltransferase [Ignavibacteria bacterium]|nr:FkbM family methyltransferase [Ignavibacteria bacterium]
MLEKFNFNLSVKINKKKFIIPIIRNIGYGNLILVDGLWKIDLFDKLLKLKSGNFIDVGVNVGQTLLELKSVNESVNYIGFEPNPNCVFYCNILINKNDLNNATIIPAGIFSESTLLSFYATGEVDGGGSVIENLRRGREFFKKNFVPVFKLDNLDNISENLEFDSVSILKIDVEGAEYHVLNGAKDFIKSKLPFILCEILWANDQEKLQMSKKRNDEIINFVKEADYIIYNIVKSEDNNSIKYIKRIIELDNRIYTVVNRELCDYLLIHSSDQNLISDHFQINLDYDNEIKAILN